ncbi:hypothetical protein Sxan_33010 [Streptomyces xanthophaeus]|uniref:Uncharacterized protein n=1 Tax=Streptomyces xanthophaeus TaxID=67385 RepID=A0A919LFG9_9ACTN|nr:hypothetical protein Sxan_33010 [Streptomyces xanthophaeus]
MAGEQGDELCDGGVHVVAAAFDEPVRVQQERRAGKQGAPVLRAVERPERPVQQYVVFEQLGHLPVGSAEQGRRVAGVGPGQRPVGAAVDGVEAGVHQGAAGLHGQDRAGGVEGGQCGGGTVGGMVEGGLPQHAGQAPGRELELEASFAALGTARIFLQLTPWGEDDLAQLASRDLVCPARSRADLMVPAPSSLLTGPSPPTRRQTTRLL